MTLYKLKHSQTTAMQIAAPGLVDADGDSGSIPASSDRRHGAPEMTQVYTLGAIDPLLKVVLTRRRRIWIACWRRR